MSVDFTQQEFKILQLAMDGKDNAEIAFRLKISKNTVRSYQSRIQMKLLRYGVRTRKDLNAFLEKNDLEDFLNQ